MNKEIDSLKKRINELENTIKTLTNENKKNKMRLQNSERENIDLKNEVKKLKKIISDNNINLNNPNFNNNRNNENNFFRFNENSNYDNNNNNNNNNYNFNDNDNNNNYDDSNNNNNNNDNENNNNNNNNNDNNNNYNDISEINSLTNSLFQNVLNQRKEEELEARVQKRLDRLTKKQLEDAERELRLINGTPSERRKEAERRERERKEEEEREERERRRIEREERERRRFERERRIYERIQSEFEISLQYLHNLQGSRMDYRREIFKEKLKKLSEEKYIPNPENKKCVICFEDFKKDEIIRRFDCLHIFHKNCIDNWLKEHNDCPICKFKI